MAEDDQTLRELYALPRTGPEEEHPDEATWEGLALDELPAEARARLFDHVTRCPACAQVFRGLRMLETEAAAFDPAVPRRARSSSSWAPRPSPWVYAGLAAAAAIVFLLLPLRSPDQPIGVPSGRPADALRSRAAATPLPLEPKGTVTARPAVFRWQPVTGAVRYRLDLSNTAGDSVWTSPPVTGSQVELPASVALPRGRYYWQITPLPDVEHPLASAAPSPLAEFEMAPRP